MSKLASYSFSQKHLNPCLLLCIEMGGEEHKKFLTVAPFECAWGEELRFREAGRGCISFEAFAQNDITLVFREQVGSQHYHYKMDNSPNYTIILGSHRNRRLKIEVDGKTVVDVAGIGLCCSSSFQSYWISIYDGLISIGNGRHPFKNLVFQWRDTHPNCSVQYVGLSSWDKHVGYRNVNVLPVSNDNSNPWSCIDYKEYQGENEGDCDGNNMMVNLKKWGLMNFLENWELSDVVFVVGGEKKAVPAHKVILAATGEFSFSSYDDNIIYLPSTTYSVFHAFLEYIYAGQTQIVEPELGSLLELGIQFQIPSLVKQCEDIVDHFKVNKKLFNSGKKIELTSRNCPEWQSGDFPKEPDPIICNLKKFLQTREHCDVSIHIEGHGLLARSHKLILSAWSAPLAKMFTNGMIESSSSEISFSDVSPEAFEVMLSFMYGGVLEMDWEEMSSLLIPVLILSDQFAVAMLQQECCKYLFEYLSEDTVCPILQAISSLSSCKLLEEKCKKIFAKHFDYCTTASADFTSLDGEIFKDILQHTDITVTSEEKVLDAILTWCMQAYEVCNWLFFDELLHSVPPEKIFRERLPLVDVFLPSVRFPLMSLPLLQKLGKSNLSQKIPLFQHLIEEAIQFSSAQLRTPGSYENVRYQHRRSSFKELQYICDGDKNGVIYFAGTSYGEHQWVNPVLAKRIHVTASSPTSRYTDPRALVSRMYQGTSYAGPRTENGQNFSWWMIDIGQDHQLICNYYTLRQDGSTAYPRSWAFQGSMDGENWSDLRVHGNEQTICRPGQFASWPVHGSTALLPFRIFRLILTGPTFGDSNLWNFSICFVELYGYFR